MARYRKSVKGDKLDELSPDNRIELVLGILQGEATVDDVASNSPFSADQIEQWISRFIKGGRNAIGSKVSFDSTQHKHIEHLERQSRTFFARINFLERLLGLKKDPNRINLEVVPQIGKHVFVSYSSEDHETVLSMCEELEKHHMIETWLDREAIWPGEPWRNCLHKSIGTSYALVACFSKSYWNKPNSYMNREMKIAAEYWTRRSGPPQPWFVPVLLEECELPNLMLDSERSVESIQHIDLYTDWTRGIDRIARAVSYHWKERRQDILVALLPNMEHHERTHTLKQIQHHLIQGNRVVQEKFFSQLKREHDLTSNDEAVLMDLALEVFGLGN